MNNDPLNLPDNLKLYINVTEKFYKELQTYIMCSANNFIMDTITMTYRKLQNFKNEYTGVRLQEVSFRTHLLNHFAIISNYYNSRENQNRVTPEILNLITNHQAFLERSSY